MGLDNISLESEARRVLTLVSSTLPKPRTGLTSHSATASVIEPRAPRVIGLTGLQGSGKSTWAATIVNILRQEHNLSAISVSLDDFYRTHDDLVQLHQTNPQNKLVQTRGQPGTHDEKLAREFFEDIKRQTLNDTYSIQIPSFDKSRFDGEGDRALVDAWPVATLPIDVIVFEGWCLGFRPLPQSVIREKHEASRVLRQHASHSRRDIGRVSTETLADHEFEHLIQLNHALGRYCSTFMGPQHFDCLVHLDTDDLANVYTWRLGQEDALRRRSGCGMSNESVIEFVRGYMPAYELYLDGIREGFFAQSNNPKMEKVQVRVCLDRERKVVGCTPVDSGTGVSREAK
jgi:D-glycerate 3-kinase